MPESQIARVRTELAQTFAVAYYQQSAPPSIVAIRFIDETSGAVVMETEWGLSSATTRMLHSFQAQPLQFDRNYTFWMAFDKPMRWREAGEVVALPGQAESTLDLQAGLLIGETPLNALLLGGDWLDSPGKAPGGYLHYRDDALAISFVIPADPYNLELVGGSTMGMLGAVTRDMTGAQVDANPSTVAHWAQGNWTGYEDDFGTDGGNTGGFDHSYTFEITSEDLGDPFVIEAGTSSAWYDPARNGEGFMLEILEGNIAVMYWFTYDTQGEQDWYIAIGEIRGNRILFPELMQASGGEFGPGFDPEKVSRKVVGSASFIWSECDSGVMQWLIDDDGNGRRHGRMNLQRLSSVMGIECGNVSLPPEIEAGLLSGSWYDPTHSGEGYILEVLSDQSVLVYWFSFDMQGNRRWFFGSGEIQDNKIVFSPLYTTHGAIFGDDFDPDTVQVEPWGGLELELQCESGIARFTPTEDGFPAGTLNLTRLTKLEGLSCES